MLQGNPVRHILYWLHDETNTTNNKWRLSIKNYRIVAYWIKSGATHVWRERYIERQQKAGVCTNCFRSRSDSTGAS